MDDMPAGEGEVLALTRGCVESITVLLGDPPKYQCRRCKNNWIVGEEPPICNDQKSKDNFVHWQLLPKKKENNNATT